MAWMNRSGMVLFIWLTASMVWARDVPQIEIGQINRPPTLADFEGMKPNPAVADQMTMVTGFIQRDPRDGEPASFRTEVYLAYDPKYIYAAFLAFDPEPEKIRARMAPRESVFDDDFVDIQFDTFNDQRRAYTFLSTPRGVQWDALWTEGGDFDSAYQAVWYNQAKTTDQGYIVLFRIPFASLRFPSTDEQTWRVMLNRSIPRLSEQSFWPHYSNLIVGRLNQAAIMTGIRDISPGRNIQVTPYGFLRSFESLDEDRAIFVEDDFDPEAGVDAKFVIADSFVLDLTANPDFSQVESDNPQVTVNQRFEVFFPERRPFFLENADFFSTPTNLVFTRRIVDPSGGARFTGKKGPYGVGVMLVNDEAPGRNRDANDPLSGEKAEIAVTRITRDISTQSTVGVMYAGREFGDNFNRVASLDARLKVNENWVSRLHAAAANTEENGVESQGTHYNFTFDRSGRHFNIHNHFIRTSPDFRTRLGFLAGQSRPDLVNVHTAPSYRFRPESGNLTDWGPSLRIGRIWDTNGEELDTFADPEISWEWVGERELEIGYSYERQRLTPREFSSLIVDKTLTESAYSIEWDSEYFSAFTYSVEMGIGTTINFEPALGFEPEEADFLEGQLSTSFRPLPPLRLDGEYFYTRLEDKASGETIFTDQIARLRGNWQFTRELSLRMIIQFESTTPTEGLTSLERERNLNTDLLLRYVINPWTAFYLGYNENDSNFQIVDGLEGREVVRTESDLARDGRQIFLKGTWLFQF